MNIVSPFGRLSRKGYLAIAVPVFVAIVALDWVTWQFMQTTSGSIADLPGTPWFRWLFIAGPLGYVLTWCLFCACVKRLHDFRWNGLLALPLLWPWLQAAAMATATAHMSPNRDLLQWLAYMGRVSVGLRFYDWALMIVLAIVPGGKRPTESDRAAPSEVF